MLEKLHIYVTIIASIVVLIVSFTANLAPIHMVSNMIITIIVFYILGLIVRAYLMKNVFIKEEETDILDKNIEELQNEQENEDENQEDMDDFSDILGDLKATSDK